MLPLWIRNSLWKLKRGFGRAFLGRSRDRNKPPFDFLGYTLFVLSSSIAVFEIYWRQSHDDNSTFWHKFNIISTFSKHKEGRSIPWIEQKYNQFLEEEVQYGPILANSRKSVIMESGGMYMGAMLGGVLFYKRVFGNNFRLNKFLSCCFGTLYGAIVGRAVAPVFYNYRYAPINRESANMKFIEFLKEEAETEEQKQQHGQYQPPLIPSISNIESLMFALKADPLISLPTDKNSKIDNNITNYSNINEDNYNESVDNNNNQYKEET